MVSSRIARLPTTLNLPAQKVFIQYHSHSSYNKVIASGKKIEFANSVTI